MRILLTGGNGMVGKNILEHHNYKKHIFFSPSRDELDLLDYDKVIAYINEVKPDLIIHAAGIVGGIQANILNPTRFLVDNLDMGRNILMASKCCRISKLINLASSCMYPRNAINPLSENSLLTGELEPTNEGYALAKIYTTKLCEYINRENKDYTYITLIPCNLYGRFDKFSPENSHMLPAVIKKIHDAKIGLKEQVEIWGDGKARREFMYAEDLADFIYFAVDNLNALPQNTNVGLGEDYSINEYYDVIASVIGYNGNFTHDLTKPVGMKQKLIDSHIANRLGWRPKTTLKNGIRKTYSYYLNHILKS